MAVKHYAKTDIKVFYPGQFYVIPYFVPNILSKIVSSLPFRNKTLVVVIKYYTKADMKVSELASFFYFVLNILSGITDIEEKEFR